MKDLCINKNIVVKIDRWSGSFNIDTWADIGNGAV